MDNQNLEYFAHETAIIDQGSTIGKGTLSKITSPDENISLYYDNLGRIVQVTQNISGKNFISNYSYNNIGNLEEQTYPANPLSPEQPFSIKNIYDNLGFLIEMRKKSDNQIIWSIPANAYNSKGQITEINFGNGLSSFLDYNEFGFLNFIKTGISNSSGLIQDYSYTFNSDWGRPETRTNAFGGIDNSGNLFSVTETFGYDEDNLKHNRLTSVNVSSIDETLNATKCMALTYNSNGNISFKTGIGNFSYFGQQPHAITEVENISNMISDNKQIINYNGFNKADFVKEDNISGNNYRKELYLTYGTANQRVKTEFYNNQILEKTKYFASNYELEETPQGTRELNYIAGPMGMAAIFVKENGTEQMYYTHSDHLGSITEITDQQGILQQRITYNAWGERELVYNNPNSGFTGFMLDRGFTGHEHLDQFKLINMNGRLYDPLLGRFLSPDNYIQAPNFTQSLNRYSYCINNPLKYVDPDGEFFILFPMVLSGIIAGDQMGYYSNKAGQGYWGGFAKGFAIGFASYGIGFGVGSWASSTLSNLTGISGGFVSGAVAGGTAGFASGFVSGIGTTMALNSMGYKTKDDPLTTAIKSAGIGLGSGIALGGLLGGAEAYSEGNTFMTGEEVSFREQMQFYRDNHGTELYKHTKVKYRIGNKDYTTTPTSKAGKNYGYDRYKSTIRVPAKHIRDYYKYGENFERLVALYTEYKHANEYYSGYDSKVRKFIINYNNINQTEINYNDVMEYQVHLWEYNTFGTGENYTLYFKNILSNQGYTFPIITFP